MALPKTLCNLGTRFERTRKCQRSPWLWLGPTLICVMMATVLGLSQQSDPRWPPRKYAVGIPPVRGNQYTISLVFDKHEKDIVTSPSSKGEPSITDLSKSNGFRLFSMTRSDKDVPFAFKHYLENYPRGTVMLIQDSAGNVVDAGVVHDTKDAASMLASLRK